MGHPCPGQQVHFVVVRIVERAVTLQAIAGRGHIAIVRVVLLGRGDCVKR